MPGALPSAVSGVPGHVVLSTAVEEAATGAPAKARQTTEPATMA